MLNKILAALAVVLFGALSLAQGDVILRPPDFVIGINDGNSDRDHNDMLVAVSGPNVRILNHGKRTDLGSWYSMPSPNEDGIPFWDQTSRDGNQMNAGFFVSGTGGFTNNDQSPRWNPATTEYWGDMLDSTNPDRSFVFDADGTVTFVLLGEFAARANRNSLSAFYPDDPEAGVIQIFAGADGVGAVNSFTPTIPFALLFGSDGGNFSSACQGEPYVVFQQADTAPVPEPSATWSYLFLGAAIAICWYFSRRRKKNLP